MSWNRANLDVEARNERKSNHKEAGTLLVALKIAKQQRVSSER